MDECKCDLVCCSECCIRELSQSKILASGMKMLCKKINIASPGISISGGENVIKVTFKDPQLAIRVIEADMALGWKVFKNIFKRIKRVDDHYSKTACLRCGSSRLYINRTHCSFYCQGCSWNGKTIAVVCYAYNCTPREAVNIIFEEYVNE